MATLADDGIRIIDADTHFTEPYDMWTSRAPAEFKDRVPHVEQIEGEPTWVVDGTSLGFARGGGVIDKHGEKFPFLESTVKGQDWVHPGAFDPKARLQVMDESGIYAQVLFPSIIGLGGQSVNGKVGDTELRKLCIEIYNDTMAEMGEESGGRFIGMPVLPAWDIDASVKEAERVAGMGLRGINMTTDPQDLGSPDLAHRDWDRLWEVCADLDLPVHFHIGSSNTAMDFFGKYFWPSQEEHVKPAIGGSMLFINSARVLINATFSGVFDRFPKLQMVLVESGIGYIPFMLETMDYELFENAPVQYAAMSKKPSEYFKSNWHATFWFEENQGDLQNLIDKVGDERILFETDFPHPTCLYPLPLDTMAEKMNGLRTETRRRIMGENAAKLYRL